MKNRLQAAGRPGTVDFFSLIGMDKGLAVGHHDELGATQAGAGHVLQPLVQCFRDLFQEVYDNEFVAEFKKRNLTY